LYPFVRCLAAETQPEYQQAADECSRFIRQQPQLVTTPAWLLLHEPPARLREYRPADLRDINEWHRHNPPPHTAYRAADRVRFRSVVGRHDAAAHLEALHALAPYEPEVTRMFLHLKYGRYGEGQPAAVLEAAYGKPLEYSSRALNLISARLRDEPDAYERFLARAAEHNGFYYFRLGEYFAQRNDEPRAVKYYELAVERCRDAVSVANNVRWLVGYYFRQGRLAEAEKLADRAAEVYSFNGLQTKGDLLFWKEQYAESFEYYHRIEERYDNSQVIVNWWLSYRQRTGRPDFDDEIERRLDKLFPKGRRAVVLRELAGPPIAGVEIQEENELLRATGLKKGDIIVGFQGQHVDTLEQYLYLRNKLTNDALNLVVWNGTAYREVTASPPNGRFGVQFGTYQPR
jgi:tetratricopeptide (TPR) repeat protein